MQRNNVTDLCVNVWKPITPSLTSILFYFSQSDCQSDFMESEFLLFFTDALSTGRLHHPMCPLQATPCPCPVVLVLLPSPGQVASPSATSMPFGKGGGQIDIIGEKVNGALEYIFATFGHVLNQ